jgi:hypothetical protein
MIHPQGNAFCGEFSPLASQARLFDVAFWHVRDMPTASDDVRFRGKTGSRRTTVKPTRLTQLRHRLASAKLCLLLVPGTE